jgi:hypothetical protein
MSPDPELDFAVDEVLAVFELLERIEGRFFGAVGAYKC